MKPKTETIENPSPNEGAPAPAPEAPKPALPMAHTYLTTRPSAAFGAQGVFVDRSKAEAEKHGDLLREATADEIARRRGGAASTDVG